MTDVETDAIVDDTDVQPTAARTRRGVFGRLYHGETAIDFYGRRWWGLGLSIALLLLSIGSLVGQGLNLSLDFKGGVVWSVPSADLTEEQARAVLDEQGLEGSNAKVQVLTNRDSGLRTVEVQVGEQTDAVRQQVQQAFADEVDVPAAEVSTNSCLLYTSDALDERVVVDL
ncbi:MAG TPA: hypothetical protein DCQ52_03320, partial [Acidimicrobiaceae bacterium]|nr:hypothetical protein [Acidimicrobiaceae bacterium]